MIELKSINNRTEIVASIDIPMSTKVLEASWFDNQNDNSFFLPKTNISVKDVVPVEDLFVKVTLTGLAKYIKLDRKANTIPIINYETQKVQFVSYKNIKKDEVVTYMFLSESFSHVTIQ